MKIRKKINVLLLLTLIAAVFAGCGKEDTDTDNPTNNKTTAVFNSNKTYGTLTDQDGNVYKTITIGTQTWMAENLRTTKYRDGSEVPEVKTADAWFGLKNGAYCNYNNTISVDTIATFGRLYNWNAVNDSRNLAPIGWHIASNAEWSTLRDYLGGSLVAGGKLKEAGLTHWLEKNESATNESGFTALPGGERNSIGIFNLAGVIGCWWSSDYCDDYTSYDWNMLNNKGNIGNGSTYKAFGFGVRCVKD